MKIVNFQRRGRLLLGAAIFLSPVVATVSAQAQTATSTSHHRKAVRHNTTRKTVTTPRPANGPRLDAQTAPAATMVPARSQDALRNVAPASTVSFAQGGKSEELIVVGSALSTANNTSANPVQIVTAKQIQQTGVTNLNDYLSRLPSIGASGTSNSNTNGGDGASCVDLRNLGQNRVLVLIDGKRTTPNGDSNCVDLNTIPVQMVQSVEILRDGGSELYGADAVSGVINIKLRHDLNTGSITMRGGITGHGDNRTGMLSAMKGWNFDHDKGNITLGGSYMTQGGVTSRSRSWSRYPQVARGTYPGNSALQIGSIITPGGTYFGQDSGATYVGNLDDGSLSPYSRSKRYNYAQNQWLVNALQDSTLTGDLHYEFNRHFDVYSNVLYAHRTSKTQLAPEPAIGSVPPSPLPNSIIIPASYPGNTAGEDLQLYRRLNEFGPRTNNNSNDSVTGMFGVRGDIVRDWKYDLSYTYGASQVTNELQGVGSYSNLLQEWGLENQVDPNDPDGALIYNPNSCAGSPGCVQSNVFTRLSPDAARYANYTTHSHTMYQLRDLNLRIHNNHIVHMPWRGGGDFGVALGMEHRGEQLSNNPDPLVQSGYSLTNTVQSTSGGFNVTEGYIQGHAQLLKDVAFAKDLSIDGQGRYSSYNTFGGAKNWKVGIDWAPTRDIRFRGTLGTSFRQPNVYELYGGVGLGYPAASDPCAGASGATLIANCMKAGVADPANFNSANSGQVPTLSGGNAALKPETGRTYTFGTVITPRWIPGLAASVTYWHYTIGGLIGSLPTQYILNECYEYSVQSYCNSITRLPNGQINTVSALDQNLGDLLTSGIDFDLNYRFRITRHDSLTVDNNFQQLVKYKQQQQPGGDYLNQTGALFYQNGVGQPRVRDYATLTWQHDAFRISYMFQYIGGMNWNDGSAFLSEESPAANARIRTPGMIQQDISLGYTWNRWDFSGGVQNIAGKNPPFVLNGASNSADNTYSGLYLGRYIFLQAGLNF
ncbi:TonB-dependent receptor plug domain-containing protein [Asaia krungthepensis]|uniref:TonB-dependent receptor protein n=1 Tax=Asaia krungthepensis NRIC 0535 TaxID=1307925 RepID=A0ABQ0Q5F0_9PROT|nr:TonB-dependent receptor [Asaia krungthepensis]GBQ92304.1 TonB-dependent receptor protein [Asaia krungthepensis NRIC 0535]